MYGVLNLNLLVLAFGSAFEKGVTPWAAAATVLYNHIFKAIAFVLVTIII